MKSTTASRNQDGFTLVEVMIASALIGFEMLAVLAMFGTAARGNAFSRKLTLAVNLAQTRIEQARNTPYSKRKIFTGSETSFAAGNVLADIGAMVPGAHPVYQSYQTHVGHAGDTFLKGCFDSTGTAIDCDEAGIAFTRWVMVCEQNNAVGSSTMSVDLLWKDAFRRQRATSLTTIITMY
jgi:prepilin-type N-terminal cleavage/methylation domain-containing protein